MKFVRCFDNLHDAEVFAAERNSKVILRYEWDDIYGLVELYEVYFT